MRRGTLAAPRVAGSEFGLAAAERPKQRWKEPGKEDRPRALESQAITGQLTGAYSFSDSRIWFELNCVSDFLNPHFSIFGVSIIGFYFPEK